MISKENLLKNFANEDKDSVIRIYNNLILAKNKDIPVFQKISVHQIFGAILLKTSIKMILLLKLMELMMKQIEE